MEKDKRLMEVSDGRDWLRGKLGLVLMDGTMLSKSLIQRVGSCISSLLFTWGQTMVDVMKIMVNFFKSSRTWTATLIARNPAAGHHQHMPQPETPGHSWETLDQSLVGSLLLSSGSWCTQGSVCACCAQCLNPWEGREKASKTMQLAKRGSLLLARARALCRMQCSGAGQRAPSPSCYTNL